MRCSPLDAPNSVLSVSQTLQLDFSTETTTHPRVVCKVVEPVAHVARNSREVQALSAGDSTGGRVSPAARCLIWYLLKRCHELQGHVVVELGCGTGVCGTCAARYAPLVLLTDADSEALLLARETVSLNSETSKGRVICTSLSWGSAAADLQEVLRQLQQVPSGVTQPSRAQRIVIGADLIYYTAGVQLLLQTIAALVEEQGYAVLAFTPRISSWREDLVKGAHGQGLQLGFLDVQHFVPAAELASGWFTAVHLALLWAGDGPEPVPATAGCAVRSAEDYLYHDEQYETDPFAAWPELPC